MPIGYVAHVKEDQYWAQVEYDAEVPFGYVIGPADVSVDQAVAWARQRAKVVVVRTEDGMYSAGEVAKGDLPVWPGDEAGPCEPAPRAERDELWEVEGHVGSRAPDLEHVALLLQAAVERDGRASNARHWLREWGLAVAFTICCPSTDSYEVGTTVLRESWAAADIPSDRIGPFRASSVAVRPAGTEPRRP